MPGIFSIILEEIFTKNSLKRLALTLKDIVDHWVCTTTTYMSPDSHFQTQTQIFRLIFFSDSDFFETIVFGLNLLFFRYLSKIDAQVHLRLYFKHICAALLFLDFPGKLPLCCKKEQFWVISIFWPPGSGQSDMFLTYVIKVDKREILRLYLKHIHVLLLFLVFPGKLPLCSQSESFWVISIMWPPRSGQFEMFLTYVMKVHKREVLKLYYKHINVLLLFLVFPGKLPLWGEIESFWLISHFGSPGSGQFEMFLTYVMKVDKREVLRLYFEYNYVLLLFLGFPGKLPLRSQKEWFWLISIIWPPGSGQFETFLTYVMEVDKREVLRFYYKHIHVLLLFFVFPGKLPLWGESE